MGNKTWIIKRNPISQQLKSDRFKKLNFIKLYCATNPVMKFHDNGYLLNTRQNFLT